MTFVLENNSDKNLFQVEPTHHVCFEIQIFEVSFFSPKLSLCESFPKDVCVYIYSIQEALFLYLYKNEVYFQPSSCPEKMKQNFTWEASGLKALSLIHPSRPHPSHPGASLEPLCLPGAGGGGECHSSFQTPVPLALPIPLPKSKIAPLASAWPGQKGWLNISVRAVGCLMLVSTLNRGINS